MHDDFPVWSGRFDRELTDVFAIQDEIALGIVNNLRLKLGRGRRRYETSVEAYDLYLRARALPEQRTRGPASEAARIYQQVIAKDPLFAPAYAGLATAYAASSAQGFKNDHGDDLARMRTAAEKAIQLDPLLAEAHEALGMEYARDGQLAQAERSFHRAIELDPSYSAAYSDFTIYVLLPLGRIDEALHQMRIAEKADPLSPFVQNVLGWALLSTGAMRKRRVIARGRPRRLSVWVERDWARKELTRQSRSSARAGIRATLVTLTGRPAAARRPRNLQPPSRQTRSHRR